MKKLLSLLLITCLFSCVTQKQRLKICNTCAVKDSIVYKENIVKKDTTIYVSTPGPAQYLPSPCADLCDSLGNIKPFENVKKKNGIKSTVKSVGKSLIFECEADSLKAVIGLLEKQIYNSKQGSHVKYVECNKDHKGSFDGFKTWWFWITAGLLLIYLALRALKMYVKI